VFVHHQLGHSSLGLPESMTTWCRVLDIVTYYLPFARDLATPTYSAHKIHLGSETMYILFRTFPDEARLII